MSEIPSDLRYTKDHEWVREQDDGSWLVGITDHAQTALGDLVFVELPAADAEVAAGDACAVVESVKAASDVYSPLTGQVTAANDALGDAPELVNSDPYGRGWLFALRPESPAELEELLSADDYERLLAELED
ncbi:MAG TPA: glycine cleavage system protein GcvH [Gammaproteobacteria bacterium]|nr:glycine cleavage system protein GcvH [Gammaproteobacteria bacterium]